MLNACPRARHADAAPHAILRATAAVAVERAWITLPMRGRGLGDEGMRATLALAGVLQEALDALARAASAR